jgi:hypothetical protein
MIEVGWFTSRPDAEFARAVLTAAGIPSVLAPEQGDALYHLDLPGGARLLVAEADAQDAAVLLACLVTAKDE